MFEKNSLSPDPDPVSELNKPPPAPEPRPERSSWMNELMLVAVEVPLVRPDSMLPVIFRMIPFTRDSMSSSIPAVMPWMMLARGSPVELAHEQTGCEEVAVVDRLLVGDEGVALGVESVRFVQVEKFAVLGDVA
jgi:hypothetical protein